MVAVERCDVDVVESVVIVVGGGAAKTVHFYFETRLKSHVFECAVAFVVIESGIRLACLVLGPVHRIHKENVLPAIVVIVKNAYTAAHRLRQIFLPKSATVMPEMDACLRCDVGEVDRTRGARRNGSCAWV